MLLLALLFAFSSAAYADVDKDKDKRKKTQAEIAALRAKFAGQVSTCDLGSASSDLDVNNVKARMYNNGGLFWIGGNPIYEVPKGSGSNAIFASGIWIGGLADGELRIAAATYGDWEFWPGPLDATGQAPADCSVYDRIFRISREDIKTFQETGVATSDMIDWPWDLGAAVIDGDGNPDNYNLDGGDLPEVIGDQTLWWIMNDAGNVHLTTETPPIGLEVQATAFAFNQAGPLGNTTFYKYKMIYKGTETLTDVYLGLWSDPDLGDSSDDYVGSDSALGIGYVYNGDNEDGGSTGYGDKPPALGYDFFQGPLVDNDGLDNDRDGEVDEEGERVAMAKFVFYNNNSSEQGNPTNAQEYYGYLKGEWRDGIPITFGGTGRGFSEDPTNYMFPADPPEFWSEDQPTPGGAPNVPSDRRFLQSAGPFTMQPGDVQEIVFGIVWAGTNDRIQSVKQMEQDDAVAQAAFDLDFDVPPPPDPPRVTVTELDEGVVLNWDYRPTDNNYLDSYDAPSVNLTVPDPEDDTYTMEGYLVWQYESANDQDGEIIAVYDRAGNGATNVVSRAVDAITGAVNTTLLVQGTDTGLKKSHFISNLTNYSQYHFAVQAYAFNAESNPQGFFSPITQGFNRVTVTPSKQVASNGGTVINSTPGVVFETVRTAGGGGGAAKAADGSQGVAIEIVDPSKVTGDSYAIDMVTVDDQLTYNIRNATAGSVLFDAQSTFDQTGIVAPTGKGVQNLDGLSFTISGPDPDVLIIDGAEMFVEIAGPGDNYACGPSASSTFGCAEVGGNFLYGSFNGAGSGPGGYIMYHEGTGPEGTLPGFAPQDYEIRFTETGSYAYHYFTTEAAIWVPFEVWDIGATYTGTASSPNDPADDVQMVPVLFSSGRDACSFTYFDDISKAPFGIWSGTTMRIYAYYPVTTYADYEAFVKPQVDAATCVSDGGEVSSGAIIGDVSDTGSPTLVDISTGRPLQRIIYEGDPAGDPPHPAFGVVQRFYTTKPLLDGDTYEINTEGLGAVTGNAQTREEALDLITVVPNPYLGSSDYEVSRVVDVTRITNLPEQATIRVFTLNGTLIRTLEKNSSARHINWDLNTEEGLPIASGMYLIHVEAKDSAGATYGERVLKFAVVKKQVQLNEL
ncbi:MAG: T9SS type A sorting domain-containing protein [Rhodothermia bacterium]|nr:T9SS type A sorting domain-containing protein [Rhodothermia bacterium]